MTDLPSNNPIERLMIYHTGLLPPGGLDESASLEELGENILYYFDSSTAKRGRETNACSTEEAVKFLGLATALHSLPLNLSNAIRSGEGVPGSGSGDDDSASNTHQVHLVHSTLVFIPLEDEYDGCNGLVAVAQIPRAGSGGTAANKSNNGGAVVAGGDPVAIRAMIQRKHADFCLLRGGSVHHRLTSFDEAKFKQQVREGDVIINRPSPRATSATIEADLNRRDAARAASVAAAEAVAQSDAAWMERWGQASIGEADHLRGGDEGGSGTNESGSISRGVSRTKPGGSDAAISLLRASAATCIMDVSSCDNADETKSVDAYMHAGMALLYSYRKELRKLNERLTACRVDAGLFDSSLDTDAAMVIGNLEEKVLAARERIDSLVAVLPLRSLRNDLKVYYDNVITSARAICVLLAGQSVGRCVVDLIPSPGLSSPPRLSCPPNDPPPSTAAMLNRISRKLLGQQDGNVGRQSLMRVNPVNVSAESAPLLLGISSFYRGGFLFSNISSEKTKDGESRTSIELSSDTVSMIYGLFFSGNEVIQGRAEESNGTTNIAGSFVQPPRGLLSFGASAPKLLESIYILSLGDVWLPQVTLPLYSCEAKEGVVDELLARVALFKFDTYEFLLFLNGEEFVSESMTVSAPSIDAGFPVRKLRASEAAIAVLTSLSRQLQDTLQRMPMLYTDRVYEGEPGSVVMYVDRLTSKTLLLNNTADKQSGTGDGRIESNEDELGSRMRSCREFLRHSDDELDCRHIMASRLPLDVVLALDEMMKEVRQSNRRQNEVNVGGSRVVELCTFLPQGWVFCRAHDHRELFGVFDPNVYITLADVQKATIRIRRELGGMML